MLCILDNTAGHRTPTILQLHNMAEQSELDKRPVEEQDVDAELEAMFEVCLFLRLLLSSCYSHPQ